MRARFAQHPRVTKNSPPRPLPAIRHVARKPCCFPDPHGLQSGNAIHEAEACIAAGTATEYVPFTDACVPHVDIAAGVATVIMPEMVEGAEEEQNL